ncbi:MAG TPA: PilZ domain-containing protein [Kofleriaceae bacterium]|nr:PilZ domain-containing protein [Kofleriaceae bacterium]
MIESRKSARHDVDLPATFTVRGETIETRVSNLSVGGALLAYEAKLPAAERVRLSFQIPTHPTAIDVGAVVRWCSSDAIGVQFDGLRAKEVWALNKYFESLGD